MGGALIAFAGPFAGLPTWAQTLFAIVFVIIAPYLGVLVYLIAQHQGMADRNMKQAQQQKEQFDDYVKSVSGGSADEIAKAKQLLDSGAITQQEFESIKAKALA